MISEKDDSINTITSQNHIISLQKNIDIKITNTFIQNLFLKIFCLVRYVL